MAKHKQQRQQIIWKYQRAYLAWWFYTRLRPATRRTIIRTINKITKR